METQLQALQAEAISAIDAAETGAQISELRIKYLGKKGELTQILRGMGALSAEERPRIGQMVNDIREVLEQALSGKADALKDKELAERLHKERIDVTLPGGRDFVGGKHPLTLTLEEIKRIFTNLGFTVAKGPEVETDYYCFEALNLPKDHPARDMQDSFYITEEILLRTHTSPVQVRVMQASNPDEPIRIICPGKVYRRDYDATHSPMFHQVEGLVIDKEITFGDLKGVLAAFAKQMFGEDRKVRLRPSFFPFTEPSAEVDISCGICEGKGCRSCGHTGWLEILGSGMVHPRVLEMSGFDPGKVTGFAFGMGVERIAMLKYGIDDLRLFFDNDIRFLRQF